MKKVFLFISCVFCLSVFSFASAASFSDTLQWSYGTGRIEYKSSNGYYFLVSGNSSPSVYFISSYPDVTFSWDRISLSNPENPVVTSSSDVADSVSYNGYYYDIGGYSPASTNVVTPNLIPFSTLNDAFAAFEIELPNLPPPGSGGGTSGPSSSFRVPAGNVLYFQVDSEQDVILDANMPKLSSFLFASNPWGDSGIRYGPAASLPSSSTTFPILSQDAVSWSVKQPTNVLGQSRVGTATKHCIVGQWYALYLPSIFGLLDTTSDLDSSRYLPGASVDISGSFSQIKVYPLESQFNWSGADFVTGSADDYETYYDGSVDENGSVTFTNQDGVVSTPPNGGSNQFDVDTNPLNLVETIKNILSNILKEIESLFTFGYDAIRSLVGIMSDFVSVFQGLYSWLPHPVYSALISAVTIAIVIGVFKVFL